MNYLTAAQTGDAEGADADLCAHVRAPSDERRDSRVDLLVEAQVFGEGLIEANQEVAAVRLSVLFPADGPEAAMQPWRADLRKEDGTWRVCGFRPLMEK